MSRFVFSIVLLLQVTLAGAQSTNIGTLLLSNIKKADHYYDLLAYRNALNIYLWAFEKNPADHHVRDRISECYFKLHDPSSAETWLTTLANEPGVDPIAKFKLAEALSMNGKYSESMFWFGQYLKERPDDELAKERINFLKGIDRYTGDAHKYVVAGADFINTNHAEYGAHYYKDGIVFASSRDQDRFIKHKPFDGVDPDESMLNLYYAGRKVTGDWEPVKPFGAQDLKSYWHEGPIAFYDNYKKAAFTKSNVQDSKGIEDALGHVNLEIYFADMGSLGALKNIVRFEFDNDGYSTAHPCFSKDGKTMYFSSTAPTGYGDADIYYTTYENGRWTEPVNLGPAVNTRGAESFPFVVNDTTLYLTSNGHGTVGGLDIYVAYKRNGTWREPINLGAEVNTRYDDFSMVADSTGRVGYFASNRPGGKGLDDIYFFISNFYFLAGEVRELSAEQARLPGALVKAYNGNGDLIDSTRSDDQGYFSLNLPYDQDFVLYGEKDGYEALNGLNFSTRGKPFGIDSLMLPMWKYKLFAKGKIYSNETQKVLPGTSVKLQNITDDRIDEVVVDDNGEYIFKVIPNRKYRIDATKDGFIPSGFNLDTQGIMEGELLNDIVLEEIYVQKETILFDFDKAIITELSQDQLDHILRTMRKFPESTLYIGAHADARGTAQYNQRLSEKRANATKSFLMRHGISAKRIEAVGFGEELLLNRCSDGVECDEEEHHKNRRAEIKIQEANDTKK